MPEDDFHRIARTQESMLALAKNGDLDAVITIWDGLDERDQRMMATALVAMVNHLRAERGDGPDDTYGPPETKGL